MSTRRVGQTEKWIAKFKDENGELFDPDDPSFEVTDPDGVATIYVYPTDPEVIQLAEGVFRFDQPWLTPRKWKVRAFCTSPVPGTKLQVRTVVA